MLPHARVVALSGLGRASVASGDRAGALARRLSLGAILRSLSRAREPVAMSLVGGVHVTGTLDRVGADHVDVAVHHGAELRHDHAVVRVWTVPVSSIVEIAYARSAGPAAIKLSEGGLAGGLS